MPTYDYACRACDHAFEHFQSISDKLLRTCPGCGKRTLDRLFGTGIGVVFKGSGFYETDYKRAGEKKPAEEGAKSDSGKSAPKKADASKDGKAAKPKPDKGKKDS
jgi:putative FmdB family regulatory protein